MKRSVATKLPAIFGAIALLFVVAATFSETALVNTSPSAEANPVPLAEPTTDVLPATTDEITPLMMQWAATIPADSTLLLNDVVNGETYSVGENRRYISASLYKLFIAQLTLEDTQEGEISLGQQITVRGENDDDPQLQRSIEDCLRLMIVISDNPCGEALGKRIGWQTVDRRLQDAGYQQTILNNFPSEDGQEEYQYTSAQDVARLLQNLYSGDLLSADLSAQFQSWLAGQEISGRTPELDEYAHKTANLDDSFHDAGSFTLNGNRYIYVILSDSWEGDFYDKAGESFVQLHQQLRNVLE